MFRPLVQTQRALKSEGLVAKLALKPLRLRMNQLVFKQRRILGEPSAARADFANERPLLVVNARVVLEIRVRREALCADLATIRPFSRVDAPVDLQYIRRREPFEADVALERPLTGVRSHVFLQIARRFEPLLAVAASVGSVSRVNAGMRFEAVSGVEGLAANVALQLGLFFG